MKEIHLEGLSSPCRRHDRCYIWFVLIPIINRLQAISRLLSNGIARRQSLHLNAVKEILVKAISMESRIDPEPRCTMVASLISDGTSKIMHIHIATSHIGTSNHKRQWKSLMSTAFPNETKKVFLKYNDLKDQIQRLKLLK